MDFASRGVNNSTPQSAAQSTSKRRKHIDWVAKTVRIELFIILLGIALLLGAVSLWLATGKFSNEAELKLVNTNQYQAVFLTNGQVYFGKINILNSKYVSLTKVFYIENQNSNQTNASTSNNNYTLRKLGISELHAPEDQMIIERAQISFWENLKDSGQVTTKIKEYFSNPDAANKQSSNSSSQSTENTTKQP